MAKLNCPYDVMFVQTNESIGFSSTNYDDRIVSQFTFREED